MRWQIRLTDSSKVVISAKAGIHGRYKYLKRMDSRLRTSGMTAFERTYEPVNKGGQVKKGYSLLAFLLVITIASLFSVESVSAEVLTLAEGLRLVTQNSRLIRISLGEEKIAGADTYIEKSRLFPTVNAGASGTMLAHQPGAVFGDLSVPMSQKDFYAYSLNVRQTLFDFRENASRYGSSKMKLEAIKLETRRIRNLAAIEFAVIYFDILESEKMVYVAGKEVERLESHLRDAGNLYDEGVITKNDLLQA
jgi:outer membrane protein